MTLQVSIQTNGGVARVVLSGRFDFNAQRQFRSSYDESLADPKVTSLEIDLGNVEYLDSSALGMLLLLKERASSANKSLALANCKGTVKQVLEVANFNKLFSLK